MSQLIVKPVETRDERRRFLEFPWTLYQGDAHWVPPLRRNQKEMVGFVRHPFHERNRVRAFLATRDGRPCGRIGAIINPDHVTRYQEPVGFFGFLETIDDAEVAGRLLDAARAWLSSEGLPIMRGPVNPSLNYECGLLVEGFDSPPTFMMTYNKPYYERLLVDYGVEVAQNLYSFEGHVDMLDNLDQKLHFVIGEATRRFKIHLRQIDKRRFHEEVLMFLDIYNQSLGGTWGFTPLSQGEARNMAKSLRYLIVPELTAVAEVDGKPIAAVFGLLDYNPRIKEIDGRLFPFGFLKLLWNRKGIRRVRLLSTNVLPEYQRWGVGLVAMSRLVPDVVKWGIKEAEFSWVLESNHLSFNTLKRGGARIAKKYRIYDIGRPKSGG
ncbi:MAG: N-acetyltransferase [Planctomycetes bacterium]|nr:N-acetyltransferase [Planctomycetota bacterium]